MTIAELLDLYEYNRWAHERTLDSAAELGMRNRDWLMTDPDLDSVRDDPRFAALLTEVPPAA